MVVIENKILIKQCKICGDIGRCSVEDKSCCEENSLKLLPITDEEFCIMCDISDDNAFLQAMIDLKEKDPIEYQLKMSQFRNQVSQQEQQQESGKPKCPTCGSTNVEKISATKKAFGGAMFGLFSSDVRNTMHCKKCGAKW